MKENTSHLTFLFAIFSFCLFGTVSNLAHADETLHGQIDQLLLASQIGPVAGQTDDSEFLRRLSLDLIGRIPTISETRTFLADQAAGKREAVINRMLASEEYAQNMAIVFDVMLMERRGGKHVKTDEFREYLRKSFAENKPYNKLAWEILQADGSPELGRAAAAFYLERDVEPNLLTREIGRVFFGKDLQCAQCHDHPVIDDYTQTDYYGLNAFFVRASLFRPDKKKPALIVEKAEGEANFKSVFTDREGFSGPRVPGGAEWAEPVMKAGEQYKVAPAKNVRHVPVHSRLAKLSEFANGKRNRVFNRNIANRLWAHMYGRGIVHPVDLHHSANPPSHPELLELLSDRFAAMNYDVKEFLKELALTKSYQLSYRVPDTQIVPVEQTQSQIKITEAEYSQQEKNVAVAEDKISQIIEKLDQAVADSSPLRDAVKKANAALAALIKVQTDVTAKLSAIQNSLTAKQAQQKLVTAAQVATQKSLEALKDDADLKSALAAIQKKTAGLLAEATKLTTTITAQQKTVDDAQVKVQANQKPSTDAIAALKIADDQIRSQRAELIAFRNVVASGREKMAVAKRKTEWLQLMIQHQQQIEQIAQLETAIPASQKNIVQSQTEQTQSEAILTASIAEKVKSEKERTSTNDIKIKVETSAKEIQLTLTLLTESITKTKQVIARLNGDPELVAATATLVAKQKALQSQSETALKTVANKTQFFVAADTKLKNGIKVVTEKQALVDAAKKKVAQNQLTLKNQQAILAATQNASSDSWKKLIDGATNRFQIAAVTAMTPEQFAWSTIHASGRLEVMTRSHRAKLDKEKPLSKEDLLNPEKVSERDQLAKLNAITAMKANVAGYVKLYAASAGQPQTDFFATVEQALFVSNGGELRGWLGPNGDNLTGRLLKVESPELLAEELYISILTRKPDQQESKDVAEYLASRPEEKAVVVQELAWALLTSSEYRFRH